MGFGKILGGAATGGISLLGKDTLLGKKDKGRAAGWQYGLGAQQLMKASLPGLKTSGDILSKEMDRLKSSNAAQLAGATIAKQETGLRASAQDAIRAGQAAVAQRGMGRSALGLRAVTQPTQELASQITKIRAQKPMLTEQFANQRIGQINQAAGGLRQLFQAGQGGSAFDTGRKGKGRSGGLLGLGLGIAGAAGAAKSGGNPMQGFAAGQGIGQAAANIG